MKCSICEREIEAHPLSGWSGGNNAQPINSGRCCDECDCLIVIPSRIGLQGRSAVEMGQMMLKFRNKQLGDEEE